MGLNAHHLRFLLRARAAGVSFERPITIGRQQLFMDIPTMRRSFRHLGREITDAEAERLLTEDDGFAEPVLRLLGASSPDAMDASTYEGASVVHDLNAPLPAELRERYSLVVDSGSLEHVFDFPRAVRSCLEMVEVGGHFIAMSPANNSMGHGFYQFSPELFYRALSPENGFRVVEMVAVEMRDDAPWYAVRDPAEVGRRVEWQSSSETYLFVCARRERAVPLFATPPQQSDYAGAWSAAAGEESGPRSHHGRHPLWPPPAEVPTVTLRARVWRRVPAPIKGVYRQIKRRVVAPPPAPPPPRLPDPGAFVRLDVPLLTER